MFQRQVWGLLQILLWCLPSSLPSGRFRFFPDFIGKLNLVSFELGDRYNLSKFFKDYHEKDLRQPACFAVIYLDARPRDDVQDNDR